MTHVPDFVGIQRITAGVLDTQHLRRIMAELGPKGGDFVIIRATPERAQAIESNLVSQLFTQGATQMRAVDVSDLPEPGEVVE